MERKTDKKKMEADESAPVHTKGRKGAPDGHRATEGRSKKFPWTSIVVGIVILIIMAVIIKTVGLGSS